MPVCKFGPKASLGDVQNRLCDLLGHKSTFSLLTFGCKVNQYETQVLREFFSGQGLREVSPDHGADLYLVNTCAVTHTSENKSRRAVRRIRRTYPKSTILAAGCAIGVLKDPSRELPEADLTLTHGEKCTLPYHAPSGEERKNSKSAITSHKGHTRAFLKVQDGCDGGCTYCIIPRVRGPSRSRLLEEVVDEAKGLVLGGYVEIVLTGIHLGSFGKERSKGEELPLLVQRLAALPRLRRIRFSSLDPKDLTEELIEALSSSPKICPHVHLPLQSGDNETLRRMGRKYTVEDFLSGISRIRRVLPEPALTTDVMVGFPGETLSAFHSTVEACRKASFSRIHIFPFSPRPGTPAARYSGQVPPPEIQERAGRLKALSEELAEDYRNSFIEKEVEILVEERRGSLQGGYTERYLRAFFCDPVDQKGKLIRTKIKEVRDGELRGERIASRG